MGYRHFAIGLVAAVCVSTGALGATSKQDRLRQQAEAMCTEDATRLCGDFIGDDARTAECMKANEAQLSPGRRRASKALNRR